MLTGVASKLAASATMPWWRQSWVGGALILFLLTVWLYAPVGGFEFVNYDDPEYVTLNTHLNGGFSWSGVVWAFTKSHSANWHPLTWLSHMLDCQLWGVQPGPHHWHNVLLHALNAVLLFGWLRKATGATGSSWVVAALFAWHPLHVESVAWVSERKDVLSAFWGLATLWCYTLYQQSPPDAAGNRPKRFYVLALVCLALGLLSKPMLVTWPFVLLLADFWPGQRWGKEPVKRLLMEKLPFLALSGLSSFITFAVQSSVGATQNLQTLHLHFRLGNAVQSYGLYLWQMLCPRELLPFYPFEPLVIWRVALAFLVLGGVSWVVWRKRRQYAWGFFGWNWYLGTLVPVIGLVQVGSQSLANRYTYLPLIGVFILVVWFGQTLFRQLGQRGEMWLKAGAAVALGSCFWLAASQIRIWQNTRTLFTPVVECFPDDFIGHAILGAALVQQTNYLQAIPHLQRAIQLQPAQPHPYKDMGDIFVVSNRIDEAIACYRHAIELDARYFAGHYQLGLALTKQGRHEEALQAFSIAGNLRPDDASTQYYLANSLIRLKQADRAIPYYERALQLKSDQVEVLNNLAYAYSQTGRFDQAITAFTRALQLNPDLVETRVNLGAILLRQNQLTAAIEQFQLARQQQPDFALAHLNLGLAQARAGNWTEAAAAYQEFVRLRPGQPDGHLKLADALLHLGQTRTAYEHMETALRLAPENVTALVAIANLLRSTTEPGLHDINRALQLAERACELSQRQDPSALIALALALRETNQPTAARQAAETALAVAQSLNRPELVARAKQTLQDLPPAPPDP